jgi:ribosomal protein S27E
MATINVQCPKCYKSFFADEYHAIICPNCGHVIKK